MAHTFTHYKTYEDIFKELGDGSETLTANQETFRKTFPLWEDNEIKVDDNELAKLPQSTQNDIATLLEKMGFGD